MKVIVHVPTGRALDLGKNSIPAQTSTTRTIAWPMVYEDVVVDVPMESVFYDRAHETGAIKLGSSIGFQKGKRVFHLNPVYHHKVDFDGGFQINSTGTSVYFASAGGSSSVLTVDSKGKKTLTESRITSFMLPTTKTVVKHNGKVAKPTSAIIYTKCVITQDREKDPWKFPQNCGMWYKVIWTDEDGTDGYSTHYDTYKPSNVGSKVAAIIAAEGITFTSASQLFPLMERVQREYLMNNPYPYSTVSYTGKTVESGSYIPDKLTIESVVRSALSAITTSGSPGLSKYIDWKDLAYRAYQDIGYADNNGIAYLKDAVSTRSLVTGCIDQLKTVASTRGKKQAKAIARSYLTEHYGLRLQLSDTASYIEELRKNRSMNLIRRCSATSTFNHDGWEVTARYQTYYRGKDSGNPTTRTVNQFLERVDFLPTLENIWDMVPYSFVVDWFIGIGDCLTSASNLGLLRAYHEILGSTQSIAATREYHLGDSLPTWLTFQGSVREKIYSRSVSGSALMPVPSYQSLTSASLFNHTVEGAALVVSKLK